MPAAAMIVGFANRLLGMAGLRLARAAKAAGATAGAPPLPLPAGYDRAAVLALLFSVKLDRPPPAELRVYAEEDCDRFLFTLGLVPEDCRTALEVGANPYFTTVLLKQLRQLDLELTNFTDGPVDKRREQLGYIDFSGNSHDDLIEYLNVNIEAQPLPHSDESFDLVLFCEVVEHMTNDPVAALNELKRVLRPGGRLILTTPNVARLENVARITAGQNVYDPYSGYGPYGRHNREYSVAELARLMTDMGFEREELFTADVHPMRELEHLPPNFLENASDQRRRDLGQYIFSRWRKTGSAPAQRPAWLYRSYPTGQLV